MHEMNIENSLGGVQDHDRLASKIRDNESRNAVFQVVNLEECGRVVGRILAPIDAQVFGPWRGAVYLTRD